MSRIQKKNSSKDSPLRRYGQRTAIILVILIIIAAIYRIPVDVMDEDTFFITKIIIEKVEDNTSFVVTDDEDIEHIVSNLNDITAKKGFFKLSIPSQAYKLTIYNNHDEIVDGYGKLTIISDSSFMSGIFTYTVNEGYIDYDYIKNIMD